MGHSIRDTLKFAFFLIAIGFFLFQAARAEEIGPFQHSSQAQEESK